MMRATLFSFSQLVGSDPKVGRGLVLNGSRSVGKKKIYIYILIFLFILN